MKPHEIPIGIHQNHQHQPGPTPMARSHGAAPLDSFLLRRRQRQSHIFLQLLGGTFRGAWSQGIPQFISQVIPKSHTINGIFSILKWVGTFVPTQFWVIFWWYIPLYAWAFKKW